MDASLDINSYNFHIMPGDVLLLRSNDKGALNLLNLRGQSLIRRRKARFTHVAIVLDNFKIIDAMPGIGVSIRRWLDIEACFDLEASRVARNLALANHPKLFEHVSRNALYYLKQPYRTETILRNSGRIRDQSGMVCSHFVTALIIRLGQNISNRPAMSTLPIDIDVYTSANANWRQFSLMEYGLCSRTIRPPVGDPYWEAIYQFILPHIPDAVKTTCEAKVIEKLSTLTLDQMIDEVKVFLADTNKSLEEHRDVQVHVNKVLEESIQLQYKVSRTSTDDESRMLDLVEKGIRQSQDEIEGLLESQHEEEPEEDWWPTSGKGLLREWYQLYREDDYTPIYLHEEVKVQNRERHRLLLEANIKALRGSLEQLIFTFDSLKKTIGDIRVAAQQGLDIDTIVVQVSASAEVLMKGMLDVCRGESVEGLNSRLATLDERLADLCDWAENAQHGQELLLCAVTTYIEICRYDLDKLICLKVREPYLRQIIGALNPIVTKVLNN